MNSRTVEKEKVVTVLLGIDMMVNEHCRRIDSILKTFKLNCRQYSILYQITRTGLPAPRTQRELAKRSGVKENRLVAILHRMVKEGLLRRNKEGDRRPNVVSITPKGQKHLEKSTSLIREYFDGVFSALTDEEKEVASCLTKIYL